MPSLIERLKIEQKNRPKQPSTIQVEPDLSQRKVEAATRWLNKHRMALSLLKASPFVWFGAFFLFSFMVLYPITGLQQQNVIEQFNQLPQLPNARQFGSGTTHKPDALHMFGRYSTDQDYSERSGYFDSEFLRLGWQIASERHLTAPGRDYCKGDYSVSISYYYTQYELWLTWGRSVECQTVRGGARLYLALVQLLFPLGGSISWGIYALIMGRVTWNMHEEEFRRATREIEDGLLSIRATKGILLLSIVGILLSSYAIATLNW